MTKKRLPVKHVEWIQDEKKQLATQGSYFIKQEINCQTSLQVHGPVDVKVEPLRLIHCCECPVRCKKAGNFEKRSENNRRLRPLIPACRKHDSVSPLIEESILFVLPSLFTQAVQYPLPSLTCSSLCVCISPFYFFFQPLIFFIPYNIFSC